MLEFGINSMRSSDFHNKYLKPKRSLPGERENNGNVFLESPKKNTIEEF